MSKLSAAYYEEQPDPDIPEQRVVFGTSGHRGSSFTDKDGIIAALLAADITAVCKKDPGELYAGLTAELGESHHRGSEAPATDEQKTALEHITAKDIHAADLAGEKPITITTNAAGDVTPIGSIKVAAANGWFAARPSDTEAIYKIYAESFKLFLLDANDFANTAAHRGIMSELYGGDAEMRLKQEIVLGIGGWRLLRELSLESEACHLNEGHAAFAVLERARYYMADHRVPFELALTITRAGNLFTTHTAVPAGFDRFDPELCRKYLGHYAKDELAISMEEFLALGRQNSADSSEPFNMAYLALRGSGQVSGVSKLHGEASGTIIYSVCCPAKRPATDYTARLVPSHAGASVPLEAEQILWQR
jgi:hypothetical protein